MPMTTGVNAPSSELLVVDPTPQYLLTALASAVWSPLPRSEVSTCDPRSTTDVRPDAPNPENLSSVLISCFAHAAVFCGPRGFVATPASAANSPGNVCAFRCRDLRRNDFRWVFVRG